MPIDPLSESTLSLSQAARPLPRLRAGRPVHPSTLWRWALTGLRGVRLETAMVGGVRVTSEAALRHFFAALSSDPAAAGATEQLSSPAIPTNKPQARRARRDEHVERQPDAEGL